MKKFENLKKAMKEEINNRREYELNNLDNTNTLYQYLTELRINQLKEGKITLDKAKDIATKKINKVFDKEIEEELNQIIKIENSFEDFKEVIITLEHKRNNYGYQYKATLSDGKRTIVGYYTNGCGYDKISSAIAEVLNEYYPIINMMYELKNKNIELNNHDLIGYGSGYGLLPYFESGVGTSTYYKIAENLGLEYKEIGNAFVFRKK